ncbi:MAG: ABC transporter substrate-binding protein [Firmicutes bacterium]|nr:ABC transporter substrate-binding protein [Bacillota bacterium]
MKRVLLTSLVLVLVFSLAAGFAAAETPKRGGTVRIAGQWGTITNNFNPFLASGQNAPGTRSALYEPLIFVSVLTGETTPVLAVSYEWKDNLTLVVETREGVTWSDGAPFSAHDVAFTFNYMKEHPALDLSGIWANGLSTVTALDDRTVEFKFESPNTPLFQYIAHTLIVPKHIWEEVDDPSAFTNSDPVVTGPFVVGRFTSQAVTYQRRDDYWVEGRPYVDQVVYQATRSNDSALLLLLHKEIDYSYLSIPDPERAFVARDPQHNHYWWPVTNSNILYLNMSKAPFSDTAFRLAMAYAINKAPLSEKAYYGVVPVAHPTGIIPGQQETWLDPSLADITYDYNPDKAREILAEAGYTWDSSGALVEPSGDKIPALRILVGAGWTDFISMAQLISEDLKAVGVTMVIEQEPWNSYINSLMGGTYDTAICWGTGGGPTPYDLYYRTLASEFAGLDGGQADSNYSRFSSAVVDEALATYRASSDEQEQWAAIAAIQREVLTQVPYIPLTYRTDFNCYQDAVLIGWPTEDNPYSGGNPGDELGARFMLLELHQR